MDLDFDVFWKDEKIGHAKVKNNKLVKNECYTGNPVKNAYGRTKDYPNLVGYIKNI